MAGFGDLIISKERSEVETQSGRVVYVDNVTDITPRQFYQYIDEGYFPAFRSKEESSDGILCDFFGLSYSFEDPYYYICICRDTIKSYRSDDLDNKYELFSTGAKEN